MTRFKPYLAYSASAGSGKTFALAARYIALLFMGESPGAILAATFTNKAAAEMRQRVVDSLRDLERDEAFLAAICDQTGLSKTEMLQKQPEVLARFLSGSSSIVTLDSFFASILRSASLELGLEPDFVTKEEQSEKLENYFLDEVAANGLLQALARLAIDIEDKRFGKILEMMMQFYRVDPLLPKHDTSVVSIAALEKEIEALRNKMIEALGKADAAKRCIDQFQTRSAKALFAKNLFEHTFLGDHSWYKKCINDEIETLYAALKERLLAWVKAKEAVVLGSIFKIYDDFKNAVIGHAKGSGVLSFDDLSYFTYRLLHESISKEFLYFKIDAKFRHILLDEFQDTSTLQFLLLKPLIDEIFAGQGQGGAKSFFYVGDTKQSLYRFRGGVEELFEKVAQRYGIQIEQMDINYRSSKAVVEQVNQWFKAHMEGYAPQKTKPTAQEGYVEVVESDEVISEAVEKAKALIALGIDIDEIAFLVSTNNDGQALQEACAQSGIHTLLKTSSSLKNLPKIAALTAMVAYLYGGQRIDAEAILSKTGKRFEEIRTGWYDPFMQPLKVLDRLVREFGYFAGDKNILKLLEFAGSFSDMPTFLEEFAASKIAVAEHSVHGASIMTVHGSKGLEFDYVIVLDKLTRKRADTSPLIFHYDEKLHVERILYRTSGREHFDTQYAQIIEQRKTAAAKDAKNVLYVALTRAIKGLFIIKKPKDSLFDEIGMSPMKTGSLDVGEISQEKSDAAKSEKITLTHYGVQETISTEDEADKDHAAIRFGKALHYALEMMGTFDEEGICTAMTAMKNRYGALLDEETIAQIEARIRKLIEDQRFQGMLKNARISKEQALSFNGELRQVDLLLEYDERYLVIDYKSSQKHSFSHIQQVAEYQEAISDITGKTVEGVVVYLLDKEIVYVDI